MTEALPERLGKYEVVRRLAFGGMAEVFLAKLSGADGFSRKVVIKRVLQLHHANLDFITMFRDEARLTAQLAHGNIVQVIEFGETSGQYYLVLEYVNGPSLATVLRALGKKQLKLSVAEVAHVAAEVARALDYAHRKRSDDGEPLLIVHRDVTPSNILLSREGEVKLTDFGIARARSRLTSTAQGTGLLKGKLRYMAPETIHDEKTDARTDLFSLGAVVHEMLTGSPVFAAESEVATLYRILSETPAPPSARNPAVPPSLDDLVMRLLAHDPARRPSRGQEVADEVAPLCRQGDRPAADLLAQTLAAHVPEEDGPREYGSTVKRRLLLVGESRTIRWLLKARLSGSYEVTEVASGAEALAALQESPPNAVICQRDVAGTSGLELCRWIRDKAGLTATPFLLLASDLTPSLEAEARASGVSRVMPKADMDGVAAALQELIARDGA